MEADATDVFLPELIWSDGRFELGDEIAVQASVNQTAVRFWRDHALKAADGLPPWADFKAPAMKALLRHLFLLEVTLERADELSAHYFRMYGSELTAMLGTEVYHRTLADIPLRQRAERSAVIQAAVARLNKPCVISGRLVGVKDDILTVECIFLPMRPEKAGTALLFGTQSCL